MATVQDFNPKLTILSLGVNDCGNYFGTAMTAYALGQLAQAAQNAGSSILFVIPYIGIPGLTNYTSWPLYMKAIKGVAGDFNAAVCNVHSYWAANPNGAGYIYTDGIHPIDAGHASIAAFVGSVL
jgi:lysophospholipase L1-like esterase